MGCEESFITIKLIWSGYLVFSLGICVHKTLTETGLTITFTIPPHVRVDSIDAAKHMPSRVLGHVQDRARDLREPYKRRGEHL